MNYNNFNPYANMYNQNLQNQLQQNMQQLQQLQGQYNQYNQMQQQQINRGSFIQVKDYQEVVNYPTDASGSPTLFMNDTQGVFWVKKFIDGTNKIQAYSFSPINDFNSKPIINTSQDEKTNTTQNNTEIIDNIMNRMVKLEDTQEEILKFLKSGGKVNGNQSDSNSKTINDK